MFDWKLLINILINLVMFCFLAFSDPPDIRVLRPSGVGEVVLRNCRTGLHFHEHEVNLCIIEWNIDGYLSIFV